mgnify:CR=1 FL=1
MLVSASHSFLVLSRRLASKNWGKTELPQKRGMEATAQTEAGSASTVSISQFPDATQPDIVRAAIKDGYYRKLLNRDTQEVLLQIMGNL